MHPVIIALSGSISERILSFLYTESVRLQHEYVARRASRLLWVFPADQQTTLHAMNHAPHHAHHARHK